jgi:hypothetical protein
MEIIQNKEEYLKQKNDPNYMLNLGHKKLEEERAKKSNQPLWEVFEELDETKAKREKWIAERIHYHDIGMPMFFILQKKRESDAEIEADFQKFKKDRIRD